MTTLLDGAGGTALWKLADEAGIPKEPVWKYNIEHPELVMKMHRQYVDVGSRIILSNTFNANRFMVKRFSAYSVNGVIRAGVRIAKEACAGEGVKVYCSVGPLSQLMEPYGDLTEEEVDEIFEEMISAAAEEGVDGVMAETFIDLDTACIAAKAAKRYQLPVLASMSFEQNGKTIMDNSVEEVCSAMEEIGVDGVGMNCSLGPVMALPIIQEFSQATKLPLVFKPNAGLPITDPDGSVRIPYTAEQFAKEVAPALSFVSYIGGCCNSDYHYIEEIRKLL